MVWGDLLGEVNVKCGGAKVSGERHVLVSEVYEARAEGGDGGEGSVR